MIRPATFSDMPAIFELFEEMLAVSRYAERMDADTATLRSLIMDGVRRHGGRNNGNTHFMVHEVDGKIRGFVFGILERAYHFGTKLRASDVFLFCGKGAHFRAWDRLEDSYIEWALGCPKVIEVMLSWTDAISDKAERIAKSYCRKGFRKCGEIWTLEVD
jgi:hypothetical protein